MAEERPMILIDGSREDLRGKIETESWARSIFDDIQGSVQPYVDRHATEPEWIVSRLQMHWKTHYTRTFVNGQVWSHGEGRAPVPTVRFAGGRDWAVPYPRPKLEDIRPYDEDERGMWLQNRDKEGDPWEWAPVSGTGQVIERINEQIVGMAEDAAFLYWYTGDEAYARFATDIFWTYVQGMYHRQNPETYENHRNARILGLATFEVIHEAVTLSLAVTYDFLRGYLVEQGKDTELIESLFKRWSDRIIEGGNAQGNWNLNQARFIVYMGLALQPNAAYDDGKGREHYVDQFTDVSSRRQTALKELVPAEYDLETGIWPEAPGYAFSVTDNILRLAHVIRNVTGEDVVDAYPVLEKAAMVVFQYLFPSGHTVGFGDTYHQVPSARSLELLIARARHRGESEKEALLTAALRRQMDLTGYDRGRRSSLFELTAHVGSLVETPGDARSLATRTFHGPPVSLVIQRSGVDPVHGLMASLAGTQGGHMHANGMALELYGQGMVLGPDVGRGSSYWQDEHGEYYREYPAHNTVIVDGESDYNANDDHPMYVVHLEPATGERGVSEWVSFSDTAFEEPKTESDQRRLVSLIRTSPTSGFYVDIYRSRRRDGNDRKHEYLYRNLGQNVTLVDTEGNPLTTQPTDELGTDHGDLVGYNYFTEKRSASHSGDFVAEFRVKQEDHHDVGMRMWMDGEDDRTLFTTMSPQARSILHGSAPRLLRGEPVPLVLVRQAGEAWNRPFVAVYEPFGENDTAIDRIRRLDGDSGFVGIEVTGKEAGRVIRILNDVAGDSATEIDSHVFEGVYGVTCVDDDGVDYLYLGHGKRLAVEGYGLEAVEGAIAASLFRERGGYRVSGSGPVRVSTPQGVFDLGPGHRQELK